MSALNPYAPKFEEMPETIPVFPLTGALLLPHGDMPLNIFEERYLNMVDDVMKGSRLIGMIQPRQENTGQDPQASLYQMGCAGKIVDFTQTPDGRYEIVLTGICRFTVEEEIDTTRGYRLVKPDWSMHPEDTQPNPCFDLDREAFKPLLKSYFEHEQMACDWEAVDRASDQHLITCLAMACPFGSQEKQALLEAPDCAKRAEIFMTMMQMIVKDPHASQSKH